MSKSNSTLPPGTPTPRSGISEQIGPRGGRTGEQAEFDAGASSPADGEAWAWLDPGPARAPQGQQVSHSKSAPGKRSQFTTRKIGLGLPAASPSGGYRQVRKPAEHADVFGA